MLDDPSNELERPPRRLEYRGPGIQPRRANVPLGAQVFAGFLSWIGGAGLWIGISIWGAIHLVSGPADTLQWVAAGTILAALLVLACVVRVRHGWRGFLPGLLLGLLLTCLVPWGIAAVVCGPGGGRL